MIDIKRNHKRSNDPEPVPEFPPQDSDDFPKVGKITAMYQKKPLKSPRLELVYGKSGKIRGEKTGDNAPIELLLLGFLICTSGFLLLVRKSRRIKSEEP